MTVEDRPDTAKLQNAFDIHTQSSKSFTVYAPSPVLSSLSLSFFSPTGPNLCSFTYDTFQRPQEVKYEWLTDLLKFIQLTKKNRDTLQSRPGSSLFALSTRSPASRSISISAVSVSSLSLPPYVVPDAHPRSPLSPPLPLSSPLLSFAPDALSLPPPPLPPPLPRVSSMPAVTAVTAAPFPHSASHDQPHRTIGSPRTVLR